MKTYPIYSSELIDETVQLTYNMDADASYMKDNTIMVKLDLKHYGNYGFDISATSPINVILYNSDLEIVNTTQSISNNGNRIEFSDNLRGIHYLRINYQSSIAEGTVAINIDCPENTHVYTDSYVLYSPTQHKGRCACGAIGPATPHVIRYDDIGKETAYCKHCGALINLDNTIVQGP